MTNTPYLGLPFIEGGQAQKHVTHNEALRILDALVQIGVLDADRTAPPSAPEEGDRHIVAPGATGAWAGQAGAIALHQDGGWRFFAPRAGWCAWSAADGALLVYDGTAWGEVASGGGEGGGDGSGGGGGVDESVAKLGINDIATAPNLLTVRSNDALFHAIDAVDGGSGDMRLQIAKDGAANTASVFFSDAYAGHAEFGLTGDNDFHLKVSADGTTWRDAVTFNRTTGRASFPGGGVRELLTANRTYYVRADGSDGNDGLVNSAGRAFLTGQKAIDTVAALDLSIHDVDIQFGDGTYTGALLVAGPWVGTGTVTIRGNASTPGNVILSTTSATVLEAKNNSTITIKDMELRTTTSGHTILASSGAYVNFANIRFGACAQTHIRAEGGAGVTATGNYSIVGNMGYHWYTTDAGSSITAQNKTITLIGTPNFNTFAVANMPNSMKVNSLTFVGSGVGYRYSAARNAVITTGNASTTYLPGNAASPTPTDTGGQYG